MDGFVFGVFERVDGYDTGIFAMEIFYGGFGFWEITESFWGYKLFDRNKLVEFLRCWQCGTLEGGDYLLDEVNTAVCHVQINVALVGQVLKSKMDNKL